MLNDSVFLRSSLNTIHGDKYNELVRANSVERNLNDSNNRLGFGGSPTHNINQQNPI